MGIPIYQTRAFARFAASEHIPDSRLCEAIERAERGLIDADLGGGVIKQRVARLGAGKSGGYRTLIAFRSQSHAFFVHGFAKNDRENISKHDFEILKKLAGSYFSSSSEAVIALVREGKLKEVHCDETIH